MSIRDEINPDEEEGVVVLTQESLRGVKVHCVDDFNQTVEAAGSFFKDCVQLTVGHEVVHLNQQRAAALMQALERFTR